MLPNDLGKNLIYFQNYLNYKNKNTASFINNFMYEMDIHIIAWYEALYT